MFNNLSIKCLVPLTYKPIPNTQILDIFNELEVKVKEEAGIALLPLTPYDIEIVD